MRTKVELEAGYELALKGLALSFKDRAVPDNEWWTAEKQAKIKRRAGAIHNRDGGHNKFLESITIYLDIEAPRYFWSEFDTYRVGVTKNSESTMHTLKKRDITQDDFEGPICQCQIDAVNRHRKTGNIDFVKGLLPEGYLQRRLVVTNYKVLRNIIRQRHSHKLPQWRRFIEDLLEQVEHPELLPNPYKED